MTAAVVWLRRAREELRDIAGLIAAENENAARRLLVRVAAKADLLAEFPDLGSARPDLDPSARMVVEGVYLIIYRVLGEADGPRRVEIVSIVDGRRDLGPLF